MAIIYAYSGAVGANDGTSWADAFTSAGVAYDAWTVGDEVWVADDHTESGTGTIDVDALNSTIVNNIVIYRMNRTTNTYSPTTGLDTKQYDRSSSGADLTFASGSSNIYGLLAGLFFSVNDNIEMDQDNCYLNFIDCHFQGNTSGSRLETGNSSQDGSTHVKLLRCTIEFTNNSGGNVRQQGSSQFFTDCVFKGFASPAGLFRIASASPTHSWIVGCDFTQMVIPILCDIDDGDSENNTVWHFVACEFNLGQVIHDNGFNSDGCFIFIHNTDSAGNTYVSERYGLRGDINIDLVTYYNGANRYFDIDGNQSLSHKMTIKSGTTLANGVASLDIYGRFTTTGAKTLSIEIIENFTTPLTKRECWLEILYLGGLNSTRWISAEDREMAGISFTPLAAGTGLSDWLLPTTGARSVKVSTTLNVVKAGAYRAVLHVAQYEAGKLVHYNPKITVN